MSTSKNQTVTRKNITSISREDCIPITMPVNDVIQEGQNLFNWAKQDENALAAAGFAIEKIEELAKAADELRYAEGVWYNAKNSKENSPALDEAMELRSSLIHYFLYAYRDNESVLAAVRDIADGSSIADKIQGLQNMKAIGTEHPEELAAINFDMKLLEKAAVTADSVSEHVGTSIAEKSDTTVEKLLRDQAYTYLSSLITEVRDCGKYVFYRDKTRYKGYVSQYYKRHRRRSKTAENEENTISEVA